MSSQEILNQQEVDALLRGVDSGAVSTAPAPAPGEARAYDFSHDARIVRGRLPTLVMINERFARLLRASLYGLLHRATIVTTGAVETCKFGEYVQRLAMPTSLNLVKLSPLRGVSLVVLDSKLVFGLVDTYFGGKGRHVPIEGREFTATESRLIQMLLKHAFANLREAWSQVLELELEHVGSEFNPQFANIAGPSEIAVVTRFTLELEGGGGDLHIVMPYATIEPIREILEASGHGDRAERDERWETALREEIEDAEVAIGSVLGRATISLAELLNLKPGDVVPCTFAGKATVYAEDVPIFRGAYGISRGQQAVKVEERLRRNGPRVIDGLPGRRGVSA